MAGTSGCGSHFARILLIVFNLIFVMGGMALLLLGAWNLASPASFQSTASAMSPSLGKLSSLTSTWGALAGVGALLLAPAATGCCGAALRRPCLLATYATLVSLGLVLQVGGGIMLSLYRKEVDGAIRGALSTDLRLHYSNSSSSATVWAEVFTHFRCCGVNNASDFVRSSFSNNTGLRIPVACCMRDLTRDQLLNKDCPAINLSYSYTKGCWEAILERLYSLRDIVSTTVLCLATCEIIMIISSVYLTRLASNNKVS